MKIAAYNDSWGSYLEFYRDDDNDSGYGANAQIARWYDTTEACRAIVASYEANRILPKGLLWKRLTDDGNDQIDDARDIYSAAWCETQGDNR